MDRTKNLVWIDLEMTGLRPEVDVILEIASLVTDSQLNIIGEGPHLIIHQPDSALSLMDDWVRTAHTKSGLIDAVRASAISVQEAEQQTLAFVKEYCDQGTALLAGNSIWQDRNFLYSYMPSITKYCNYRLIDISAIKEVVKRWYPDDKNREFKKADTHRALADIRESIAELQHYRTWFFKH
jgi:oligoribonuclease